MHPILEAHRDELIALAHRRGVTRVRVFGSMSRGDAKEDSDVDLLVTLSPGTSALALGGLLIDAEELLGRRVDVVTEAGLHPALRERVLADAAERVNDFATPGDVNLVCERRVHCSASSPQVAG